MILPFQSLYCLVHISCQAQDLAVCTSACRAGGILEVKRMGRKCFGERDQNDHLCLEEKSKSRGRWRSSPRSLWWSWDLSLLFFSSQSCKWTFKNPLGFNHPVSESASFVALFSQSFYLRRPCHLEQFPCIMLALLLLHFTNFHLKIRCFPISSFYFLMQLFPVL